MPGSAAYNSACACGEQFDEQWIRDTTEALRARHGEPTTAWTKATLRSRPGHMPRILVAASATATIARRQANGVGGPADRADWFVTPPAADADLA